MARFQRFDVGSNSADVIDSFLANIATQTRDQCWRLAVWLVPSDGARERNKQERQLLWDWWGQTIQFALPIFRN